LCGVFPHMRVQSTLAALFACWPLIRLHRLVSFSPLMRRPPPSAPLFPYTTLFRSIHLHCERPNQGTKNQRNKMTLTDLNLDDFDVEVVLDEMPPPPKRGAGRPSKYHAVIDAARKVAAEARRKKQRAADGGAPWVKAKE